VPRLIGRRLSWLIWVSSGIVVRNGPRRFVQHALRAHMSGAGSGVALALRAMAQAGEPEEAERRRAEQLAAHLPCMHLNVAGLRCAPCS
jgi:hypothetical protein